MREPYNEGLASHIGPESCGWVGNDTSEALTGVHAGRVLSRVSSCVTDRSADAVETVGRQYWIRRYRKAYSDSARSKTPCTHGNSLHRNWEILCSALSKESGKVRTANPEGATQ
ncbi:hypothetical protein STSP2_01981 [Anaerohalosphaera lusitana]|uniref:Uncharacterized protein n=1 Tax=Anaerohalosphaera lusitana TaxID=1936003 RepID=A0A1U9NIU5_9BACT|nr:hypothetical protein STSP2_00992 [Anaerohalosphaera lusitana]AQT68775.1 hypothetical protein STSP2_01947 [Anaerohalosphaera lusitana]AQT68806.1 hypothetical protein STSP2_01981 [Anaerohalosphaera lusitana]